MNDIIPPDKINYAIDIYNEAHPLLVDADGNLKVSSGGGGSVTAAITDTAGNPLDSTTGALDVYVTNSSGGGDVNITEVGGNPVTTTVPVSGTLTISNFPSTYPVTGTFWQTTQPVSIATMPTTPVTGTFWQTTQPVSGAFYQATQPISASSLPLPALASTSTKQSDGSQKTQLVDGSGNVVASTSNALNIYITGGTLMGYSAGTGLTLTGTVFSLTNPVAITLGGTNSAAALTNGLVMVSSAGSIVESAITTTILNYLSTVSSNVQTQINGKQATGNYVTALTGDVTASGPGSVAATLATVNSNVGSFTNANITVNGKGLITAASNGTGTIIGAVLTGVNFTTTSSTLVDITGTTSLSCSLTTGHTYEVDICLVGTSSNAAGCEWGLGGSATGTLLVFGFSTLSGTTTNASYSVTAQAMANGTKVWTTTTVDQMTWIKGTYVCTGSGTLTAQILSVSGTSTTTILVGSYMKCVQLT